MADLLEALHRYGKRLHRAAGDGHHVVSPLGAWLVLALCAPLASGRVGNDLARVLGLPLDEAAEVAGRLLADPHPVIASAAAAWTAPTVRNEALTRWLDGLGDAVERGPVPSQVEADAWAEKHTLGLIPRFPLEITPDTVLLLATALATKVSWRVPFRVVAADELGRSSPWSQTLERVLATPQVGHWGRIAVTPRAGRVAAHFAASRDGLVVGSVIAEDPRRAPAKVLAAAEELVCAEVGDLPLRTISLFDLPLGPGPLWSIEEEIVPIRHPVGGHREERFASVLPAWSAASSLDLKDDPLLGFAAAAEAVAGLIWSGPWAAGQEAVARYTAIGFEAAAVTGFARRLSRPREGPRRTATVRFGHPYAVVAVPSPRWSGDRSEGQPGASWNGLPVFSAWVAEPENA